MSTLRRKLAGLLALSIALAAPALVLVGSISAAPVCNKSWAAPIDGNWTEPLKWSPTGVPAGSDNVCITLPGSYKVTVTGLQSIASVQLGGATGTQELVIEGRVPNDAAYLLPSSEAIIGANSVVTLTSFGGSSQAQFGQNSTVITNGGTINSVVGAGGNRVLLGSVANNGDINIDAYTQSHSGGTLTNNGTVDLTAQHDHFLGNNVVNASGSVNATGTGARLALHHSGTFT